MKISIIMPSYNDAESIEETLESVRKQNYKNWELLISIDGSTDNTIEIIEQFIKKHKEKRIKYYYEDNQDQLNAINNVADYITKDSLVLILHSDDILAEQNVLENIIEYFKQNEVDAIIANLPLMNESGKDIGIQHTKEYKIQKYIPALQLLWLGRNLYADTFVAKEKIFQNVIRNNYIKWNMPFWLNGTQMLNVKKVDFPIIKYRVFEGNYINNEIGKLNVINGELRTATSLMKDYHIPLYRTQYTIYRIMNKLKLNYIPIYQKQESKNKKVIIDLIIAKRFGNSTDNLFLNSLKEFYKNYNKRTINLKIEDNTFLYYGKDMRKFNNDLLNGNLPDVYLRLLEEMQLGFDRIIVKTKEEKEKLMVIIKFLCIHPFVTIENEP